ncbi:MAG: hypothetical protein AAFV98_04230 [Chloroflexota bacterium]
MSKKTKAPALSFDMVMIVAILALVIIVGGISLYAYLRPTPPPQIAYLYPIRDGIPNLWVYTLDDESDTQPEQVTFTTMGVYDYDVSDDGRFLMYSTPNEQTLSRDIYQLNLRTGNVEALTTCASEGADCYAPAIHPTDPILAYTRVADNVGGLDERERRPRIWLRDLETNTERPLSPNPDDTGHSAVWSRDGNTLAYTTDTLEQTGTMVFQFADRDGGASRLNFIPSGYGSTGTLSPDGTALIIPDLTSRNGQIFSYLKWVDFTITPPTFENFTSPDEPVDDVAIEWHPDQHNLTVARRYTDERWTRGYQLYTLDTETNEATPLFTDNAYSHHFFAWHPDGEQLVMQRLPLNETGNISSASQPSIWVFTPSTQAMSLIADDAYLPHWVVRE